MALSMALAKLEQPLLSSSTVLRAPRNPAIRIRQAVRNNNVSLLQRLATKTDLRNTDRNRLTSLSWAAVEGSLEVFEWLLLDYGHDDQELSRDSDNNTILHLLASVPSTQPSSLPPSTSFPPLPPSQLPSPAEQSRRSLHMTQLYHALFPFLLDWSNSGGKTALHIAAQSGNAPFISLLLSFGADADLTDLQGNTPLHYAAAWGHINVSRTLLEGGASWGIRNFEGFSPRDYAFSDEIRGRLEGFWEKIKAERRDRRRKEAEEMKRRDTEEGEMYQGDRRTGEEGNRWRSGSQSTSTSHMGSAGGSGGAPSTQGFPFEKRGGLRDLVGPPVTQYPRRASPQRGYSSPPAPDSGYATPRYEPTRSSPHLSQTPTPAMSRHNSDGPLPALNHRSSPIPSLQPPVRPKISISEQTLHRVPPSPTQDGYVYDNFSTQRPGAPGRSPSLPSRSQLGDAEKTPAKPTAAGPPVSEGQQASAMGSGVPDGEAAGGGMRRSQSTRVGMEYDGLQAGNPAQNRPG